MPSITREQARKWDAKCSNGFHFDIHYYLIHGEKEIRKYIPMPDGRKLEARLLYREEWKNYRRVGVRPTLHLSVWQDAGNDMMRSSGLGKYIDIGEITEKKNYAALCARCGEYTDTQLLALAAQHKAALAKETIF